MNPSFIDVEKRDGENIDKVDVRLVAIYPRLIQREKYALISNMTGLPITLCHNAVKKFLRSPDDYMKKIHSESVKVGVFVVGAKDHLISVTSNGKNVLKTKKELLDELRKLITPSLKSSDHAVFLAAKRELSITKQVPKKSKKIIRDRQRVYGEETVKKLILKKFFMEHSMAIFDSTTFSANFPASKVWAVAGNRPQTDFPNISKYFHAHCIITKSGFQAITIQKGSTKTGSIRLFFLSALEAIKNKNGGYLPFDFILLDNALVDSTAVLEEMASIFGLTFVLTCRTTLPPIQSNGCSV